LRSSTSGPKLNPPMDTVIQAGDKVIAISEDDDTVRLSGIDWRSKISAQAIRVAEPANPQPERTLILGWNGHGPMIINELDNYVAPRSQLTVVADLYDAQADIERECNNLRNQVVACHQADTTNRRVLDGLDVNTYDQAIILCYADVLDQQAADARTLITLLHLRDMAEKTGGNFRVVSEMLDVRNRELAEVTRADDFIVSNKLVSLMLAQVSENKELNAVFADIFDPEGSEIYLKPAGNYVALGQPINFYTVVEAARRRGEVAIGYRRYAEAEDAARAHGVVVNPDKSNSIAFDDDDRIIVLAEQ
jgi:hypothetical protein